MIIVQDGLNMSEDKLPALVAVVTEMGYVGVVWIQLARYRTTVELFLI
jgi:hypothetical protein